MAPTVGAVTPLSPKKLSYSRQGKVSANVRIKSPFRHPALALEEARVAREDQGRMVREGAKKTDAFCQPSPHRHSPPINCLEAPVSIGGRLQGFMSFCKYVSDPWALEVVSKGYAIEFL